MVQWTAFAAITGVVLVLLLVLSHLTQSSFADADTDTGDGEHDGAGTGAGTTTTTTDTVTTDSTAYSPSADTATSTDVPTEPDQDRPVSVTETDTEDSDRPHDTARSPSRAQRDEIDPTDLSTGMLLANVAISQGLFLLLILGAILYTGIPAWALGIEFSVDYLTTGLLIGTVAGILLYIGNEFGAALATRFGFDHDERLRSMLAPDSARGWLVLLLVVLPIIAIFEELLFRAALIGVLSAGFDISPWLLAVFSSIAFALGHGMQGTVGIIVTGALGLVLAALFIVTGSFLVVVVAHYLINALEFVVHEAIGLEWSESLVGTESASTPSSTSAASDSDLEE
ncbi:Abi/CAAX domain protein [Natrialba magadii ATCC 43099]|uniref:Abi/CAAX domain protein n=1 Tax=Natrialba magadii (strain ATCC 43099 / DSM 3394 / CCM 3739 / CIP 104546 / IAM 13178 / JCM 8861 / NBRC 102185 / NCIMB 2190 / MS3) TaxID=547559 RepID=D3SZW5_NATMM|nr:type II CAAX endopeptidase family protein [Natrialba magadii]ADD06375.1 Abi/CAAX domain protein [Natrialba magadii ATCC 43099]ELY31482.1 hypothetical protein C500_06301 [Natrialba magadii ATCC 43099]